MMIIIVIVIIMIFWCGTGGTAEEEAGGECLRKQQTNPLTTRDQERKIFSKANSFAQSKQRTRQ